MCESGNLKVGQDVPEFEIETYDPKTGGFGTFSLKNIKKSGKWTVLFFYPADYTFVCPTELADMSDKQEAFRKAGAEIVSVSMDTKFVHLAWQREEKLLKDVRFLMGADQKGELSRMFGVYDEAAGLSLRGTFLISPEGRLAASEVNYLNVGRNAEELLRKVQANVYVADHPEQACPAKWSSGKAALTPGADLVGRVAEVLEPAAA